MSENRRALAPPRSQGRSAGIAVVVLLALGLVPSAAWKLIGDDPAPRGRQSAPDPRYATQSGSLHATRRSDVAGRAGQEVAAAADICAGVGLEHLAARYGVPAEPRRVARRFARGYE